MIWTQWWETSPSSSLTEAQCHPWTPARHGFGLTGITGLWVGILGRPPWDWLFRSDEHPLVISQTMDAQPRGSYDRAEIVLRSPGSLPHMPTCVCVSAANASAACVAPPFSYTISNFVQLLRGEHKVGFALTTCFTLTKHFTPTMHFTLITCLALTTQKPVKPEISRAPPPKQPQHLKLATFWLDKQWRVKLRQQNEEGQKKGPECGREAGLNQKVRWVTSGKIVLFCVKFKVLKWRFLEVYVQSCEVGMGTGPILAIRTGPGPEGQEMGRGGSTHGSRSTGSHFGPATGLIT